jgi:cell division protein FtsQ
MAALDATGEGVSHKLSEVDLSNPEDIKAIIPETGASNADILVHFGEEKYLERYHQYQEHLAEWRTQYPHLASVDMRYEQQVVLQMQPGTSAPTSAAASATAVGSTTPATTSAPSATAASNPVSTKIAPAIHASPAKTRKPAAKPAHKRIAAAHPKPAVHTSAALQGATR